MWSVERKGNNREMEVNGCGVSIGECGAGAVEKHVMYGR